MYAIIKTGGKQYRVSPGDVIRVEKVEQALGSEFDLTEVLMIGGDSPVVGAPTVSGATVTVVVTKQTKDRKVIIFKKKRRQGYRRFKTHRQPFSELFIKAIAHGAKVAKTDSTAKVVDIAKMRIERVAAKVEAKEARRAAGADAPATEKTKVKLSPINSKRVAAKKKVAKKASSKSKKTGAAKKVAKKK
jgi:large subunit ribosomal protein L21